MVLRYFSSEARNAPLPRLDVELRDQQTALIDRGYDRVPHRLHLGAIQNRTNVIEQYLFQSYVDDVELPRTHPRQHALLAVLAKINVSVDVFGIRADA